MRGCLLKTTCMQFCLLIYAFACVYDACPLVELPGNWQRHAQADKSAFVLLICTAVGRCTPAPSIGMCRSAMLTGSRTTLACLLANMLTGSQTALACLLATKPALCLQGLYHGNMAPVANPIFFSTGNIFYQAVAARCLTPQGSAAAPAALLGHQQSTSNTPRRSA